MRLSWNEIRARAARFAEEWAHAHYERGESQTFARPVTIFSPFDGHMFAAAPWRRLCTAR